MMLPPDRIHGIKTLSLCDMFAKKHNLNLIMRKEDKPRLKDIQQNNWPILFKNVERHFCQRDKERLRNHSGLKETK